MVCTIPSPRIRYTALFQSLFLESRSQNQRCSSISAPRRQTTANSDSEGVVLTDRLKPKTSICTRHSDCVNAAPAPVCQGKGTPKLAQYQHIYDTNRSYLLALREEHTMIFVHSGRTITVGRSLSSMPTNWHDNRIMARGPGGRTSVAGQIPEN
jgi:hypothetical protein